MHNYYIANYCIRNIKVINYYTYVRTDIVKDIITSENIKKLKNIDGISQSHYSF